MFHSMKCRINPLHTTRFLAMSCLQRSKFYIDIAWCLPLAPAEMAWNHAGLVLTTVLSMSITWRNWVQHTWAIQYPHYEKCFSHCWYTISPFFLRSAGQSSLQVSAFVSLLPIITGWHETWVEDLSRKYISISLLSGGVGHGWDAEFQVPTIGFRRNARHRDKTVSVRFLGISPRFRACPLMPRSDKQAQASCAPCFWFSHDRRATIGERLRRDYVFNKPSSHWPKLPGMLLLHARFLWHAQVNVK